LAPLTISPASAVFDVQPTPVPWSARHSQVLSPIVLGLFDDQAVGALLDRRADAEVQVLDGVGV